MGGYFQKNYEKLLGAHKIHQNNIFHFSIFPCLKSVVNKTG